MLANGAVARATAAGFFLQTNDDAVAGLVLTNYWTLDAPLAGAVQARFSNQEAPGISATLTLAAGRASSPTFPCRLSRRETVPPRPCASSSASRSARNRSKRSCSVWTACSGKSTRRFGPAWERRPGNALRTSSTQPWRDSWPPCMCLSARPATDRRGATGDPLALPAGARALAGHRQRRPRRAGARILYGLRISMTFGFLLVVASMVIGIAGRRASRATTAARSTSRRNA